MSRQMRDVLRQQVGELRHEPTAKRIRAELGGRTVVDSTRALLVWEPRRVVPVYAVPVEDVTAELVPSPTRTACAYKGEASYWTVRAGDLVAEDMAWSYEHPLPDAVEIAGLVAFFDERLDLVVDGVRRGRPLTPWSR